MGRHRRRSSISSICRSIIVVAAASRPAGAKVLWSTSGLGPTAKSRRRNISLLHGRSLMRRVMLSPKLSKTAGGIGVGAIMSRAGERGAGVGQNARRKAGYRRSPPVGKLSTVGAIRGGGGTGSSDGRRIDCRSYNIADADRWLLVAFEPA